jgi:GAF domain-containing protein
MRKSFFAAPVFIEDEEKTRIAGLLNMILFSLFFIPLAMIINAIRIPENRFLIIPVLSIFIVPVVAMMYFMRRGYIQAVSNVTVVFLLVLGIFLGYLNGGQPRPAVVFYPLIVVIAGLLLGGRGAIITAIACSLIHGLITYAGSIGLLVPHVQAPTVEVAIATHTVGFIFTAIMLRLASQGIEAALARARVSEFQLNERNRELQNLSASLEQRIQDRTEELSLRSKDLEVANQDNERRTAQFEALTQVTQAITSIRDLQQLLPLITTLISEKFGFYHVGIFLLDDTNEFAVMTAANSEGGKKMLARQHRLRVGQEGIVGSVTSTGEARIAMDVGKDAVYFDNPELPDTHSEMALPLKSGTLIVGALDVQSIEQGAFTPEDIQMLSLLADQVSLAIENARLFEETRRALSESETISHQLTREAWARVPVENKLLGYRYSIAGSFPLNKPLDLDELDRNKNQVTPKETSQVIVPIELRGETIGTLVVQSPSTAGLNQDQISLIKAVAERVALSAENARLFEETNRRAERERLVTDITGKIRSGNDPQSMIQTAMDELRKALGASKVEVIPQTVKGAE